MGNFEITERELLNSLVDSIGRIPNAHASLTRLEGHGSEHQRIDAIIDMSVGDRPLRLLVEARREAYPRDIRELLWRSRAYLDQIAASGSEVLPFLAARSISHGARDLLREEGVGFYDLGGSLFIPGRAFYIYIDHPPPKRKRRILSLFEGQKARSMMTLFAQGQQWVGVTELAQLADVSPSTVSATLGLMERQDWVETKGLGPSKLRRLRNPKALVDEWAAHVAEQKPPVAVRYYVPSVQTDDLCRRLDDACRAQGALYAVTGEAAAQLYAPYLSTVSQVRCRVEPGSGQARVLEQIDARPVSEGWNLAVIESKSRSDVIVGEEVAGIALAPPLQIYLDLLQGAGRAKEMAAHFRSERLGA